MKRVSLYSVLRISLLYAVFGSLWIALSDRLLFALFTDPYKITMFQTYKGSVFVMLSTLLLYASISRELKRREHAEELVMREKEQAQKYLDIAGVILVVIDGDQRVSLINKYGCEILGYREEELIGRNWFDIVVPERFREKYKAAFQRLMSGEIELAGYFESPIITKGGEEKMIAWRNIIITDERGGITSTLSSGDDITEQKQIEAQIRRHIQRLDALRTIDMAISTSLDLRVTLSVFLDQVITQLNVDAACVLLLNEAQELEYAAGRGFRSADIERSRLLLGEGAAGKAALERRTISVLNPLEMQQRLKRFPLIASEGFVAYYGVPLIAKGQVKGVLEVFHRFPLDPKREWLDFLDALASQASIAIDNAELYEDLQRAITDLNLAYDATLEGWGRTLELRDVVTEGHTRRVTDMAVRLAGDLGVRGQDLVTIRRGAFLHDIGKIGIPDRILLKKGSLTAEEWNTMRLHPVYAYELLMHIPYLRPTIDIPYCHHEWWDGTGYPRGLKGESIPLAARIFAVVDVWDALRSERPYHPSWPEEKAREHIRSLAGTHLDPKIVDVFLSMKW